MRGEVVYNCLFSDTAFIEEQRGDIMRLMYIGNFHIFCLHSNLPAFIEMRLNHLKNSMFIKYDPPVVSSE